MKYGKCAICKVPCGFGPTVINSLDEQGHIKDYAHQECYRYAHQSSAAFDPAYTPESPKDTFYDIYGRVYGFDRAAGPDKTGFYKSPSAQYLGMRPAHTEAGLMDLLDNCGFTRGVIEWRDGTIDFYLDEKQVTPHRVKSMTYHRMAGVGWNFKTLKSDIPHGSFVMIKSKPRVAAT